MFFQCVIKRKTCIPRSVRSVGFQIENFIQVDSENKNYEWNRQKIKINIKPTTIVNILPAMYCFDNLSTSVNRPVKKKKCIKFMKTV